MVHSFKTMELSAGNISTQTLDLSTPSVLYFECLMGAYSSETIRGQISDKLSHLEQIKLSNKKDWGSYLAGLVEGDGHFNKQKKNNNHF